MENLEIKQIIQHLEKQEQDINQVKKGLSILLKKSDGDDVRDINQDTMKFIRSFIHKHTIITKQVASARESAEKIKIYFDGILSNLPLKTEQHLIFRGKIKWQVYLLILFVGFVMTTSAILFHNSRDNTNYKEAWRALIEAQSDKAHKQRLTNFLQEYKDH